MIHFYAITNLRKKKKKRLDVKVYRSLDIVLQQDIYEYLLPLFLKVQLFRC